MASDSGIGGYGPTIIAVMWAQTIIALMFVCMRLYTRLRINHVAGWDDYLILVSWVGVLQLLLPQNNTHGD